MSSGEKILVALAITIFQDDKTKFPELILLDEIDATLHPSMIEKTLNVIKDVFIRKGSKVIMATHSPTTIAHAPEESVYEIIKGSCENKIVKIDKNKALDILTNGFATLNKGLLFLDKIFASDKEVSIITEGNNTRYIEKAIQLCESDLKNNVDIITGIEAMSGKNQLKTLFDLISIIPHQHKILFIWDCDCVSYKSISEKNNTIPFVFDKNDCNTKIKKGIENLFSEELFEDKFYSSNEKTTDYGETNSISKFNKSSFEKWVCGEGANQNFENFEPLIEKIKSLVGSVITKGKT